ncbi:MAG: hypothetical protein RIC55_18760 [Pirellulaceae bacterium]
MRWGLPAAVNSVNSPAQFTAIAERVGGGGELGAVSPVVISDFGFQISDFRFQISDFRFQISDFRL